MAASTPEDGPAPKADRAPLTWGPPPERKRGISAQRGAKLSQYVAAEIVRDVVARGLHTGDRLPTEAQMLEEYDVGRASLREGLRILEAYGLINIKQGLGGGPMVSAINPGDLARTLTFYFHSTGVTMGEVAEARHIIEPASARLAAERQDATQMAELRDIMEREQTGPMTDPDYLDHSNEFHYAVSGLSGNRVLDLLGRSLRTLYQTRVIGGGIFPPESRQNTREVHRRIGEAILSGNGELAETLMREHLLEITDAQEKKTPGVMDQTVEWEAY